MKIVFVDCEFTSSHLRTTLISVGLVTLEGKELYIVFNDYDRDQLTRWVEDNVLVHIDKQKAVFTSEALAILNEFFTEYSQGKPISLISAGKSLDLLLIFQLWHTLYPELKYFSYEKYLPEFLNHRKHFDLDTIFYMSGYDPDNIDRVDFVGDKTSFRKHDALYDAHIVRKCFLRLLRERKLSYFPIEVNL
ncbi:3'-5' exoribonuclease [Leptospira weilii]|uniref:3'-5' exoribonuclease n=1 Tax=Leptospira weilii TaxID=28184 RepID=UPI001EF36715|nr:3'-5' exoribonuclease [Leptospira weilii]ULH30136.1 3'-5' exoribonuclease [Leptospira weilii]UPY78279.1 3'-5' exoribonuclease [Leptospira weilii]